MAGPLGSSYGCREVGKISLYDDSFFTCSNTPVNLIGCGPNFVRKRSGTRPVNLETVDLDVSSDSRCKEPTRRAWKSSCAYHRLHGDHYALCFELGEKFDRLLMPSSLIRAIENFASPPSRAVAHGNIPPVMAASHASLIELSAALTLTCMAAASEPTQVAPWANRKI